MANEFIEPSSVCAPETDINSTHQNLLEQGYPTPAQANMARVAEQGLSEKNTLQTSPDSLWYRAQGELTKGELTLHVRELYDRAIKEAQEVRDQKWVESDLTFKKCMLGAKQKEAEPKLQELKGQIQDEEKKLPPEKQAKLEFVRGRLAIDTLTDKEKEQLQKEEQGLFSPREKQLYNAVQKNIEPLDKLMHEIDDLEAQLKLPEKIKLDYADALHSRGNDQDKKQAKELYSDVYQDPRNQSMWHDLVDGVKNGDPDAMLKRDRLNEFGIDPPT